MKRILFYAYDHRDQPDAKEITMGFQAVFDGVNCPVMIELEDPNWDQHTFAICSQPVEQEILARVFKKSCEDDVQGFLVEGGEDLHPIEID